MSNRAKVLAYVQACDHSPTVREIAEAIGTSHSTVHYHLGALELSGDIRRIGEQRRIYPAKAAA